MDADVNLGFCPPEHAKRDAVHFPTIPMVAGEPLTPGEWVGIKEGKCVSAKTKGVDAVGFVDPCRRLAVKRDGRFWLCLFPKTVKSLRHHWTHPAFPDEASKANDEDVAESERWLRAYAAKMNGYEDPDVAYDILVEGLKSGDLYAHGTDLHGFHDLNNPDELRYHAEKVLGIRIDWDGFFFSCSC